MGEVRLGRLLHNRNSVVQSGFENKTLRQYVDSKVDHLSQTAKGAKETVQLMTLIPKAAIVYTIAGLHKEDKEAKGGKKEDKSGRSVSGRTAKDRLDAAVQKFHENKPKPAGDGKGTEDVNTQGKT